MKLATLLLLSLVALYAQSASDMMNGSLIATVNYAQDGSPKVTGSIGYLTSFSASVPSTASYSLLNVMPVAQRNATGKLQGYVFQTTMQTGVFQRLLTIGVGKPHATMLGVCGQGGVALTDGGANGALSACGLADVRLGAHLSGIVIIRGQYITGAANVAAGWTLQPSVGVRYTFKGQ